MKSFDPQFTTAMASVVERGVLVGTVEDTDQARAEALDTALRAGEITLRAFADAGLIRIEDYII